MRMEAWCPQRGRRGAAPNPESLALGQKPDNCFRVFDLRAFGAHIPCKSCPAPRGTLFRLVTPAFLVFSQGAANGSLAAFQGMETGLLLNFGLCASRAFRRNGVISIGGTRCR